jgi:hypothetical protein
MHGTIRNHWLSKICWVSHWASTSQARPRTWRPSSRARRGLYQLIGFRNCIVAMLDWAYDYLRFDPPVRLITGDTKEHTCAAPNVAQLEIDQLPIKR